MLRQITVPATNYGSATNNGATTVNTILRLRQDPGMLQKYGKSITDQENRGVIETISEDNQGNRIHYIHTASWIEDRFSHYPNAHSI